MANEWATPEDIRRAANAEEAAKALAFQSEQAEIAAKRVALLDLLRGNDAMVARLRERWAAAVADPSDSRTRRVVEL